MEQRRKLFESQVILAKNKKLSMFWKGIADLGFIHFTSEFCHKSIEQLTITYARNKETRAVTLSLLGRGIEIYQSVLMPHYSLDVIQTKLDKFYELVEVLQGEYKLDDSCHYEKIVSALAL